MPQPLPGTSTSAQNSASGITFAFTAVANKALIVDVALGVGPTADPTSVTFNGIALTKIWGVGDGTWDNASQWYLANPSVGTFNVVMVGGQICAAGATQWAYVDLAAPYGTPVTASSRANNTPVVAALTNDADSVIIGCAATDDQAGINAGQTALWEQEIINGDNSASGQYSITTGSIALSWTGNDSANVGWACGAVKLNGLPTEGITSAIRRGTFNRRRALIIRND